MDNELEKVRKIGYELLKWTLRALLIIEGISFLSYFLTITEESTLAFIMKAFMLIILMGVNSYLLVHADKL